MQFTPTRLSDVLLLEPQVFLDGRGSFIETYRQSEFTQAGIPLLVQENQSSSHRGVLRGLHYQLVQPQGKLVRITYGAVFDVAVDLRRASPTFGQWVGEILSAENRRQMWIPVGFAHGFYVLTERADVVYKVSDYYNPSGERTLRWDDPQLSIAWPQQDASSPVGRGQGEGSQSPAPLISAKDAQGRLLADLLPSDLF